MSDTLTVLEWAEERLANSQRIALTTTGEDRESWLEDVAYWREIVARLTPADTAASSSSLKDLAQRAEQLIADVESVVPNRIDFPEYAGRYARNTQTIRDLLAALRDAQETQEATCTDLEAEHLRAETNITRAETTEAALREMQEQRLDDIHESVKVSLELGNALARAEAAEREVAEAREELADQRSTFTSFAEHHAATELAWDADKRENAALRDERDRLKAQVENLLRNGRTEARC